MSQASGYAQYFGATGFLIFVLVVTGSMALFLFNVHRVLSATEILLVSPIVGIACFTVPLTIVASREVGISSHVVWITFALLVAPPILKCLICHEFSELVALSRHLASKAHYLILGVLVGFIPYLMLFSSTGFPIGFGTSATWTNNDLGAYIQMATNVSETGIGDAGLTTGWNAGYQASFDHPGAHALFAAFARLLHREPYQIGIVLMATIIATLFLGGIAAVGRITQKKSSVGLAIALLVVVTNPPMMAAVANFFFPQITSISIAMTFGVIFLGLRSSRESIGGYFLLGLLTATTWLISIEIAAVMMTLISFFVLAQNASTSKLTSLLRVFFGHIGVFAVLALVKYKLLKSQFDVMTQMSASGVAGWKSNFASPSMLLGFIPNQFGGPYSNGTRFWDLLLGIALIGLIAYALSRKLAKLNVGVGIFVLFLICLVAIQKWGIDAYQTWKLITTFTPFFFVLLAVLLCSIQIKENVVAWAFLPLLTVGATFSWSGSIWKDSSASYLSRELAQITHTSEIDRQDGLNVVLNPFFETMAASVMSGVPTRMSSPSYYYFNGQEILYRCTLTTEEKLASLSKHGPVIAQRGKYVLVGTPRCN